MGSSRRKKRPVRRELICSRCETKLEQYQIYCFKCGEPTSVLRRNLSALKTIGRVWESFKEKKGSNYGFAIFFIFVLLLPLGLIVFYTREDYYLHNLLLLIWMPFLLIPFSMDMEEGSIPLTIKRYLSHLRYYPKYFGFMLLNLIYFFLLKLITTSVDPILNLVRLIMVLYWLAIVVPLPCLIIDKKVSIIKAWLLGFKGGKETRWQQFYLYMILGIFNIIGLCLIGLGLLITVPFSVAVIQSYYSEMDKCKLFPMSYKINR